MVRRKWTVLLLEEFFPSNANLLGLNVNGGESVKVRVRKPGNRTRFYEYESILHTLLHELVHIEIGPHDASFYRLLDELLMEATKSSDPGAAGKHASETGAFLAAGEGVRLGDWSSRSVPRREAASAAAAAAVRRAQKQSIMGSGVVGGGSETVHLVCDPREMACAAAERRRKDDIWCRHGSEVAADGAVPVQRRESEPVEVIELDSSLDIDAHVDSERSMKTEVIVLD
jgi:DNA-dependent metalloprotease WSS1